jgi:GTPase Era involved in 16S rRNA processing
MSQVAQRIHLSLVSHTNVGKTTLARTLLGRDIGEVLDQAHVTATAESHAMIELPDGSALLLWDTPGFGDSTRLAKRLRQRSNPLGWFLGEVLDRWLNRPLWSSQQAIKNVRDESDVVLYLVNASENPADVAYVDAEMEILSWTGKPVIVLLNQSGEPRPATQEAAEQAKWQGHLGRNAFVRNVLPMDAFARCWVQELTLLDAIGSALPEASQATFKALQAAWQQRRLTSFVDSARAIGGYLGKLVVDVQKIEETGFLSKVKQTIGFGSNSADAARDKAMAALAGRASLALRALTDELIVINGLKGRASHEVLHRLAEELKLDQAASTEGAAVVGGVLAGALSGLSADLMAGGLTLGAGALVGAIVGALGGAGIAKGYNIMSNKEGSSARWSHEALNRFFGESLLLYLAVAHFGRGRGEWSRAEHPPHWRTEVSSLVTEKGPELDALWQSWQDVTVNAERAKVLSALLEQALRSILARLYPASPPPSA